MKSNTPPTVPGSRYGRLLVLKEAEPGLKPCGRFYRRWFCLCDCGKEAVVRQDCLRGGFTRSCGCLNTEKRVARAGMRNLIHGKWLTPEFKVWGSMIERCLCRSHHAFHRYGGRGITVCERWRQSFAAFLEDMGERPSADHSLDRIDNDGPYSPENCRWATREQQNRNRATNHFLTFNDETLCLTDWAKRVGLSKETLRQRMKKGWSAERALTTPLIPAHSRRWQK